MRRRLPLDVRIAIGVCLWAALVAVSACVSTPKPCPLALEVDYTKALVAACADAGSLKACPAYSSIRAEHEAEQIDAGCRVKP